MEIMLFILAAAYAVGSKNNKDTNVASYKAGKEPPGLERARMRHAAGGGRFVTRPGKNGKKTTKPQGPGATRLLLAQRWAAGCEKARTRGEDKLRRWHAWYAEQAPQRDEDWRAKQQKKMQNRANRLAKWQGRWNSAKNTAGAAASTMTGRGRGEQDTTGENTGTDPAGETTTISDPPTEPAAGAEPQNQPGLEDQAGNAAPVQGGQQPDSSTSDDGGDGTPDETSEEDTQNPDTGQKSQQNPGSGAAGATTTSIGELMDYQQAVSTLISHADEVDGYDTALTGLGQDMETVGWGSEVHGELDDMHTRLATISTLYRDLAESVQQQGDAVSDSYDDAPWAPDRHVLTQ